MEVQIGQAGPKEHPGAQPKAPFPQGRRGVLWGLTAGLLVLASLVIAVVQGRASREDVATTSHSAAVPTASSTKGATNLVPNKTAERAGDLTRLEVAHAVMVTVELDFGAKPPSIAEALTQVERRSQPEDGVGRTFAILDAYGAPTADGKLHMSMHVSSEKPGLGSLVFKRTGEVLWRTQIVKGTNALAPNFANKGLVILLDNGAGRTVTVDGSNNPKSVLEAKVKEMQATVGEIWPEGSEREVTFLYSACGCPVKVLAMRVGDKTERTGALPVIFPDDPAVVTVIKRLMGWD